MSTRLVTLALAALALPQAAVAEGPTPEAEAALDACIENTGLSDLAAKDCYVALAVSEDERLNANWARLIKAIGGKDTDVGKSLLAEQRAWIGYKDVACQHYLVSGGTLDRLQAQICYTDTISRRADEIEELADFYQEINSPE
ncbi:lysozyme inhibitor LprI family protein [Erythrobacter donghaensis]|uniref:lysozyme inhibitor LprI family protein n=1 Tax=Erythrobacter donghaensis TaxID=267135 RepID=UPI000A39CCAB|nr:lysozyme inhibitor LprI family protein [Erythrobacter donghaensis]